MHRSDFKTTINWTWDSHRAGDERIAVESMSTETIRSSVDYVSIEREGTCPHPEYLAWPLGSGIEFLQQFQGEAVGTRMADIVALVIAGVDHCQCEDIAALPAILSILQTTRRKVVHDRQILVLMAEISILSRIMSNLIETFEREHKRLLQDFPSMRYVDLVTRCDPDFINLTTSECIRIGSQNLALKAAGAIGRYNRRIARKQKRCE